jgi:class 3 adenylate cyclase
VRDYFKKMKKIKSAFLFSFTISLLFISVLALPVHSFAQNKQIDSLRNSIANSADTHKVRLYIRLSYLFNRMDVDSSYAYAMKGVTLADKTKDSLLIAEAQLQLAIHMINKAHFDEGISSSLKAFATFQKRTDYTETSYCANVIGNGYIGAGYPDLALQWYRTSLSYGEKSKNKFKIAVALFGMGNTEYDLKDYDSAFVHFKRCEDLFINLGKKREALGVVLTRARIIFNQNQFYESLQLLLNTKKDIEQLDDKYLLGNYYEQTGACYRELKKYKQAFADQYMALHLFWELKSQTNLSEVYNNLAKTHHASGNGDSAYYYSNLYIVLNDSIFNADNSNKIAELQAKFVGAEKEKELLRNEIQNKQTQADLAEKANQQILLMIGLGVALILALFAWRSYRRKKLDNIIIAEEKKKSDELLLNILPFETAEELKLNGSAKARNFEMVTVMFTDFKGFTAMSEKLSAEELVQEINESFIAFDNIIQKYGIEKIKTIGDAYMAAGGLPTPKSTHALDVVNAALEILEFTRELKKKKGELGFEIRIGIHSGPVVAGIVGIRKFAYDIWGDTVNTASRMESSGEIGKVNISGSTYELVKHQFNCFSRGKINAKGKGEIEMYFVDETLTKQN